MLCFIGVYVRVCMYATLCYVMYVSVVCMSVCVLCMYVMYVCCDMLSYAVLCYVRYVCYVCMLRMYDMYVNVVCM